MHQRYNKREVTLIKLCWITFVNAFHMAAFDSPMMNAMPRHRMLFAASLSVMPTPARDANCSRVGRSSLSLVIVLGVGVAVAATATGLSIDAISLLAARTNCSRSLDTPSRWANLSSKLPGTTISAAHS